MKKLRRRKRRRIKDSIDGIKEAQARADEIIAEAKAEADEILSGGKRG